MVGQHMDTMGTLGSEAIVHVFSSYFVCITDCMYNEQSHKRVSTIQRTICALEVYSWHQPQHTNTQYPRCSTL